MFDSEKSFDSSLSGLGNFSTYLDKDPLSSSPTVSSLQQLPSLNTPVDNAGNTLATARNVGTLTATQSFSDWVGSVDIDDYYSFNVTTPSNVSLNLTGLSADVDLYLLNSSGTVISSSIYGATSESITSQLSAGTYYARVNRYSGDTTYGLSLNATAVAPVDNAGNTLATARAVGTLTATQSFSDWVGSVDIDDYYSFNVTTPSNVSLNLTGLSADVDLYLLNSSGTVISSSIYGATSESITSQLSAGTYYARVNRYSGDTTYGLSLNATAVAPVDNAGNTLATARAVGTLTATQSFSDWVGSVDIDDYYSFNVTTPSNVNLNLTGLSADVDLYLLNSSGTVISSSGSGTTSESITSQLSAGTYYARVNRYSGDTTYGLSLNATALPVDNAGNTLATARNVGTLTATQSFSDWVGSFDIDDYYSFNVTAPSNNVNLSLTGLSADVDLYLLNSSGTVISSSGSGTTSESITSQLSAGTYYARVNRYSGDTTYGLSLNATALPVDNAGNTLATARAVGTLTATQSFSDWVGSVDIDDYYSFNVTTPSNVNLNLTGLSADVDLYLLNSSGTVISSSGSGTTSESITSQLSAGTYYARVNRYSGDTTYGLSLNATALPVDNAGNTLATARNVGTLTATQSFSDWVGSFDIDDYYSFNVTAPSNNVNLSLTGLSADVDLYLLNSSGTVISSSGSGTTSESITSQLSAGTYYARVNRYRGDTTYGLSLNATALPVDNAGNTLATARNVGTLTATQSFSDWVGSADIDDYYSFNVTAPSNNVNLSLTGLSADVDLYLLNSSGTVISSSGSGTTSESITSQLSAGTYYARVNRYRGDTTYSLSLNATDNAGNTLATARAVGTLTATQSFSDWVASFDIDDYYSFNVTTQSNVSLNLTGLIANANVELLNSSGGVISSSTAGGNTSESITSQLSAGTYYARVYQFSGNTMYNLSLNATTSTLIPTNWYSQNLVDAQITTLTRSLAADGNLSRNDMIAIFRDAKDGGVIDASELTDLRTIVSNSTLFTMVDSVKVLSNKIANSDVANTRSTIGNLFAGSSDTQMENLIGKWFLGTARPVINSGTYSYVNGSLFQNGLSANDIDQGALGTCYYLANLASIAQEKPDYIQNMFRDNGDNTFTVRFYNNGVADYVTVDRYLPTNLSGNAVSAGWGVGSYTSTTNELWVALAEKAYAQLAESGWSRSSTSTNSYAAIEAGWMGAVISQVAGLGSSSSEAVNMNQTQLINLVNSNQILTVAFVHATEKVVNGHAYTITAYNDTNGTFHLRNPWGSYHADVTWSQLVSLRGIMAWSNT